MFLLNVSYSQRRWFAIYGCWLAVARESKTAVKLIDPGDLLDLNAFYDGLYGLQVSWSKAY